MKEKEWQDIAGVVHEIAQNVGRNENPSDVEDLAQDMLLQLWQESGKTVSIYTRGQIRFYVARLITNNINSKTSRYYYNYKKNRTENLEEKENRKEHTAPDD